MNNPSTDWYQVLATFQKIWGYSDFRHPQGEIVSCLLNSQDALVVLPTGAGKSICFQLPALLQNGLTIVISPLIALMENQVQELQLRHLWAGLIHSELSSDLRKKTLQAINNQKLKLVYLSPETLFSSSVWQCLIQPHIKINALIIDEAHCLVQWGETFRPEYLRLGVVRRSLLDHKPAGSKMAIAAFTATADLASQKIISKTLKLDQPQLFLINPYRQNLNLQVKVAWSPKCRRDIMLSFISKRNQQSGLIYVRSRQLSEELTDWFNSLKYQTCAYHAGLTGKQRRDIETKWLNNQLQFVISTSAFGMGINKSDLRWVIHFHAPQFLSEYLQEVGRSGRDGLTADCLTLVSEATGLLNPEDKRRQNFFAQQLQKLYSQAEKLTSKIPLQGDLNMIVKQYHGADIALALLHSADQLEWLDPFHYRRYSQSRVSFRPNHAWQQNLQKQMSQYLTTSQCRWQFLLNAFGFHTEADGFKCGHCDHCLK